MIQQIILFRMAICLSITSLFSFVNVSVFSKADEVYTPSPIESVDLTFHKSFTDQLENLETLIPDLSGLSLRWEQMEGSAIFIELLPLLHKHFGIESQEHFSASVDQLKDLPWESSMDKLHDVLGTISRDFVWHTENVGLIESLGDLKRATSSAIQENNPDFQGADFFASCMDKAEEKQVKQTGKWLTLLERELQTVADKYTRYVSLDDNLNMSEDVADEIVKVRIEIDENLREVQKSFRESWKDCVDDYKQEFYPVLEQYLEESFETTR